MGEREDKELRLAIRRKDIGLVESLLNNGALVNNYNTRGETPLHLAVTVAGQNRSNGKYTTCIAIVEKLIDKGAKIDIQNAEGNTSLHLAVTNSDRELIMKLSNRGGNVYIKNMRGETPLELSVPIELGCPLIDDCMIKPTSDQLKPVLEKAVRNNFTCLVDQILTRGVAVDTRYDKFKTSLHIAAENNLWVMFDKLIQRGADIEARDVFGRTPLFYAAGSEGFASLHFAAMYLLYDLAKKIINAGADVNVKNDKGETPLHYAILHYYNYHCEHIINRLHPFVSMLIEKGADIEAKTNQGDTPLLVAFKEGNFPIVNFLLRAGADFNALLSDADPTPHPRDSLLSAEELFALEIFKLSQAGLLDNTKNSTLEKYGDITLLLPDITDEITKELSVIKETVVYENVTLDIIFSKYRNPYYVSNEKLVMALEDKLAYHSHHYHKILENILEKSKRDYHMMQFSTRALAYLLEYKSIQLPIEIIHIISQYLDSSSRYQIIRTGVFSDVKAISNLSPW